MVLKKPGPLRGKGFEKPQVRGGNGFEKVARTGSLGFENRHARKNQLRGVAIGRKNWLFAGSFAGRSVPPCSIRSFRAAR
jgi:hypothetical protein